MKNLILILLLVYASIAQAALTKPTTTMISTGPTIVKAPGVTNPVMFGASVTASCSSTPCTIAQSYGSNLTSITRSSAGQYAIVMTGLSATPLCQFNATETTAGNGSVTCNRTSTRSSTSYGFSCKQGTAFLDYNFEVSCIGTTP